MRDRSRIPEMVNLLEEIWNENPDLRLGQLIVSAAKPSEPCPQVFYIEDDVMLVKLKDLLSVMRAARKNP
jgi:uncharacterized protein YihD (DUF1040 family)